MKLPWDTEIDTPATVAVIGGGAIGIEAALYARFLGYYVVIVEGAKMAQSWRRNGVRPMITSFGNAASPLGLAALEAHRPGIPLPSAEEHLSGIAFAEKYLVPVAKTDLFVDCVHVHSRVATVSRVEARRESIADIQDRADMEFRLAIHSKNRGWFAERADIILDCSGVSLPRAMGPGGGLAMGELELSDLIAINTPDILGKERNHYAGSRIFLAGTSQSALLNLCALNELIGQEPLTRVTWMVPMEPNMTEPIQWLDRLRAVSEEMATLCENELLAEALSGTLSGVVTLPALGIERITNSPSGLSLRVQVNEDSTLDVECDAILSNMGMEPDWDHASPLRLGASSVLDRPAFEFASFSSPSETQGGLDELQLAESILTMEPHYYVLGSKSHGLGHDRFSLAQGHQQIRSAFALIGGRPELDLYSTIHRPG